MSLLTTPGTPRRFWRLPAAAALAAVFAFGGAACKQGVGEVCQIDDDCEDGLECNAGTMRCQEPGGTNLVDAAPEADAMDQEDAAPADAGPDAATPDAATSDAAPDADI